MGDRCRLQVRTLKAHAPLFEEIGLLVEDEHEPNEVVMVDEQANFGLAVDLERLAKRGVVFLADASAGEQYGPELTVSDGTGKVIAVAADFESNIVVRCDDNGLLVPDDIALVQRYVVARKRAESILEGRAPHPRECQTCGGSGDLGLTADRVYGTRTCPTCAGSGIHIKPEKEA